MSIYRLDKFLADMGVGTRSEVKKIIKSGRVKISKLQGSAGDAPFLDVPTPGPDFKVNAETDKVYFDGKLLEYTEYEYYLLNKPMGVVSATEDKTHTTVVDLIKDKKRKDLFPVGRLDKDTEGLLIITNDGGFAHNVLAPGKHVDKTYFAVIDGKTEDTDVRAFKEGVDIGTKEEPELCESAGLKVLGFYDANEYIKMYNDKKTDSDFFYQKREGLDEYLISKSGYFSDVLVTIHEGKYHQVKRMFEKVGKSVIYLKRISFGVLDLPGNLKAGEYEKMSQALIELAGGGGK